MEAGGKIVGWITLMSGLFVTLFSVALFTTRVSDLYKPRPYNNGIEVYNYETRACIDAIIGFLGTIIGCAIVFAAAQLVDGSNEVRVLNTSFFLNSRSYLSGVLAQKQENQTSDWTLRDLHGLHVSGKLHIVALFFGSYHNQLVHHNVFVLFAQQVEGGRDEKCCTRTGRKCDNQSASDCQQFCIHAKSK